MNKSNYKREGTDASTGVKSYVGAEVFLDDDVHPYWLAYYGNKGTREEFKEYHELFIRNTDFGSGMAGVNQKLLSNVKQALEESEKHSEIFERRRGEVEKKETEAKRELRGAFFKDFSLSSNPSGCFDQKELFRKWYRDNFLGEDYEEKIEKTRKAKSRAFEKWVKKFNRKLKRQGFTSIG
ncbi:hypothetical protein AKJ51_00075 [candidate division MSBL1 archaeon SCGC-AAA382A20]|uniref:Uncharacterized protein n=1 Tax=candidate division MSBL1 archaeon SCGC-AAA382A20 TaxID=1698280 RepID=A0A133VMR2_9EURY|nr:hypothetical protein AKJ51_00075 [candidate division MSBL1 archaeon SCGC-AAA382A20]